MRGTDSDNSFGVALRIDPGTHWLLGARRAPSPYSDERPEGAVISLVVLHSISLPPGQFGGGAVEGLFTGQLAQELRAAHPDLNGLRVSAHLFIRRNGEVVQCVPFDQRAWHAGRSSWRGNARCNDYSIGIEIEGMDHVPYDDAQYATLRRVLMVLWQHYPGIARNAVVGHEHIAPGRKTDPGPAFDWRRLVAS